MSTGLPALSVTLNVTVGALPGAVLSTLMTFSDDAGERGRAGSESRARRGWRRRIPVRRHWGVAVRAHVVVEACGRLTWFSPVAKFTSSWQEPQAPRVGFVFQLSACGAFWWQTVQSTDVPREDHSREVRPCAAVPDAVRSARLHARQILAHVDLVDQDGHVLGELGVGIDGLRRVAEDAHLHRQPRAAVAEERVVALVAGGGGD